MIYYIFALFLLSCGQKNLGSSLKTLSRHVGINRVERIYLAKQSLFPSFIIVQCLETDQLRQNRFFDTDFSNDKNCKKVIGNKNNFLTLREKSSGSNFKGTLIPEMLGVAFADGIFTYWNYETHSSVGMVTGPSWVVLDLVNTVIELDAQLVSAQKSSFLEEFHKAEEQVNLETSSLDSLDDKISALVRNFNATDKRIISSSSFATSLKSLRYDIGVDASIEKSSVSLSQPLKPDPIKSLGILRFATPREAPDSLSLLSCFGIPSFSSEFLEDYPLSETPELGKCVLLSPPSPSIFYIAPSPSKKRILKSTILARNSSMAGMCYTALPPYLLPLFLSRNTKDIIVSSTKAISMLGLFCHAVTRVRELTFPSMKERINYEYLLDYLYFIQESVTEHIKMNDILSGQLITIQRNGDSRAYLTFFNKFIMNWANSNKDPISWDILRQAPNIPRFYPNNQN